MYNARNDLITAFSPVSILTDKTNPDIEMAKFLSRFYDDPLGFVMAAYPWDSDPAIQIVELPAKYRDRFPHCTYGPDRWACELLDAIGKRVRENGFDATAAVPAVRVAVKSGHGIGKSALTAWVVHWLMSTRAHCRGTVTANTANQLATKTWAGIYSWVRRSINRDWFSITSNPGNLKMTCRFSPSDWFVAGITCRKEEAEAFAGQHAANSSSFYIFDEASAIPREIWDVAEGGLTDGEPFLFAFGNPTRNSGRFYDFFNQERERERFILRTVDSRNVQITNKEQIQEWEKIHGENSDFFKVRVRGEFPDASSEQFIPTGDVERAMARPQPAYDSRSDTIAFVGVDVARFGDDDSVIYVRINRSTPIKEKYHGLDGWELGAKVVDVIERLREHYGVTVYVNIDAAGVGASPVDYLNRNGYGQMVAAINFGAKADDSDRYFNKRAEMWGRMRDWIKDGGVLDENAVLKEDLTAPEYTYSPLNQIKLEPKDDIKDRIGRSPDEADALALTFARIVNERTEPRVRRYDQHAEPWGDNRYSTANRGRFTSRY